MKVDRLETMTGGWFVGDFNPTLFRTREAEVAVKTYRAGTREAPHVHRVATEITVIVSGRARMAGRDLTPGDIVTLMPGEASDFEALTDVALVATKLPSVKDDKYAVG